MNIDPSKLRGPISFQKYVHDGGWCSTPFFQLSVVLIEILSARGIEFAFSRIGPVLSRDGVRLFLMTTGYAPGPGSNLPLITENSANYMHAIGMDRVPFFQVHCTEQEKLVEFALATFADLFEQIPLTEEERDKISNAIALGNTGNPGENPYIEE